MRATTLSGPGWGGPARVAACTIQPITIQPVVDTRWVREPGWSAVDDDGNGAGDDAATTLSLPAHVDSLVLVRLLVGGLAAQHDLSVDAVEDLQLAVDEACLLLLEAFTGAGGRDGRLDLTFARPGDGKLQVAVRRPGARPSGPGSEVTTLVLDALTSAWSMEDTPAGPVVRIAIDTHQNHTR